MAIWLFSRPSTAIWLFRLAGYGDPVAQAGRQEGRLEGSDAAGAAHPVVRSRSPAQGQLAQRAQVRQGRRFITVIRTGARILARRALDHLRSHPFRPFCLSAETHRAEPFPDLPLQARRLGAVSAPPCGAAVRRTFLLPDAIRLGKPAGCYVSDLAGPATLRLLAPYRSQLVTVRIESITLSSEMLEAPGPLEIPGP
jgi:hypothetical protein